MLRDLKTEEFNQYIDYAYQLAMSPDTASYPIFYDGLKTKQDFINGSLYYQKDKDFKIKLFIINQKVLGWINFYPIDDDKSIHLYSFLVEDKIEVALDEFIKLINNEFKDYTICFGFPEENHKAINYLKNHHFVVDEVSNNTVLLLDDYEYKQPEINAIEINKDNFDLFRKIHDQANPNMYWTSDRLLQNLNRWTILLIKDQGAIYYFDQKVLSEIFGIDIISDTDKDKLRTALIINALNKMKQQNVKKLCFFTEDYELDNAVAAGFKFVGKYFYLVK